VGKLLQVSPPDAVVAPRARPPVRENPTPNRPADRLRVPVEQGGGLLYIDLSLQMTPDCFD